ncbi:hypothetical protein DXG01_001688 [Tephrocybe rancida]|nr:hypothetical protein DXG01_001688 [Tephrocybe rancida]
MSLLIFERPILSQFQSLSFLVAFFKAWYLPPRVAFVPNPMALPLPPPVQEILEILVPAPTQTFTPEPTRSQPVLNITGSPATAPQDLIGPLRFATIVAIIAVASFILISVVYSEIENAISYYSGKSAKSDSTRKRWGLLSCVLLTVGIISGARYASSRFGLDLVDLDPIAYVHTAFLAITRTGAFSYLPSCFNVGLIFRLLKRSFNAMFAAVARGVQRGPNSATPADFLDSFERDPNIFQWDPTSSMRLTHADFERLLKHGSSIFKWDITTRVDIERLFGPLKRGSNTAFTAAASGVQCGALCFFRNALLKLSRRLLSVNLGLLFGPLKRGFDTAFLAAAWGVHWRTLTSTLRLSVIVKYLLGPFAYAFNTASTGMTSGVQWIYEPFSPFKVELRIILPHVAGWIIAAVIGYLYQSTRHNPGPGPATAAPSVPVHFPIPALVRCPLELLQAARSYARLIYNAPRLFHELEDRLIHETHQAETARNAEMGVRHMYQEQARELHRVRHQLSDHADDLRRARSRCYDLEERNALLEEGARDGLVTREGAPPDYEEAIRELGAFDDWSAAVVSGAAAFAPPRAEHVGEPPAYG